MDDTSAGGPAGEPDTVEAAGRRDPGADSPLRALRVIASQDVAIGPELRHLELYTLEGLLTILWHSDPEAESVVVMGGGAMGGLLGPADGLFHHLGAGLAERGIATMRVSYRRPNDLRACTLDLAAAADLASRRGARRFVTVGHSFGGAIALRTALLLGRHAAGVVTLSTQSAGCEQVDQLDEHVPVLLIHGDQDELLPPMVSEMVQMLLGRGELVLLPGEGHLLAGAGAALRDRLLDWIPGQLEAHAARDGDDDPASDDRTSDGPNAGHPTR